MAEPETTEQPQVQPNWELTSGIDDTRAAADSSEGPATRTPEMSLSHATWRAEAIPAGSAPPADGDGRSTSTDATTALDDSPANRFALAALTHPQRLRFIAPPVRAWAWFTTHSGERDADPAATGAIPLLAELLTLAPPAERVERPDPLRGDTGETRAARGPLRRRVGLMLGCAHSALAPAINVAAISALTAEGCEVVLPRGQGCCGALSSAVGRPMEAERLAQRLAATFGAWDVDAVVTCAPVCAREMREHGVVSAQMSRDQRERKAAVGLASRLHGLGDFLLDLPPHMPRATIAARMRWHTPGAPAATDRTSWSLLLRAIPGLEVDAPDEGNSSVTPDGMAALLLADMSAETDAVRAALDEGFDALVCEDPASLLRLRVAAHRLGVDLPALHPIELVDASIHGVIPPALGRLGRGVARERV